MKISACIIAKNEEDNLPRLLKSLKGKFDEIILVDTGSTDRTVEIAKEYGCRVYYRKWNGFSDARNYASSKASGDWIWHFDADFELDDEEYKKAIFYLKNVPEDFDAVMIGVKNLDFDGSIKAISSQIFIHRNKPHIKWVGKVHECVNVDKSFGIPVFVKHYGYEDLDVLNKKAKRNLKLLEEEIKSIDKKSKTYLFKLFYIVQSYLVISQTEKNEEHIRKIMEYIDEYKKLRKTVWKNENIKLFDNHMYTYAITSAIQIGDFKKAEDYINEIKENGLEYPDLVFYSGILNAEKGNYEEAVVDFIRFFYQIDKVEKNPFYEGENKLTESINRKSIGFSLFNKALEKLDEEKKVEIEKKVKKFFKETKGVNTGLCYYYVLKSQKKPEYKKFLNKLVKISQSDEVYLTYAVELLKENKTDIAVEYLEKAYRKNKKNAVVIKLLADIFFSKKDYEKSLFFYKEYTEITRDVSIKPRIDKILSTIKTHTKTYS